MNRSRQHCAATGWTLLAAVFALAWLPARAAVTPAEAAAAWNTGDSARAAALYGERVQGADAGPRDFYRLAVSLRRSGDPDAAAAALDSGVEHGLPAGPAAAERAHVEAARGAAAATAAALQAATAAGFTPFEQIEADPAITALAGDPAVAAALDAMRAVARPCTAQAAYRAFDFWLGTWEVHTADGTLAGHNRITSEAGGCRIDEHWQSASGGTGRSINFLDPGSGEWVQIWHSPAGLFIRIRGGLTDDGSMLLEGTAHYAADGREAPFRGRWTPLPDGRVRQFFEQYSAQDKAWQPWFEGFYRRIDPQDMPDQVH